MKYYSFHGGVESDRYADEIIRKQRIQRLQEVRKYGSKLSRDRCKLYNEKLSQRMKMKGEILRDARVAELESEYNRVLHQYKKALVDNGQAHRAAAENAVITIHKLEEQEQEKEVKKQAIVERGQEALVKRKKQIKVIVQKKATLLKNREAVVQRSRSDREHAKATAESRVAKAKAEQKRLEEIHNGPLVIDQDHITDSASSAKLMQKGHSAVRAKVMKHGATRADISIVNNTATVEANVSLKKRMDRCLEEMKNKLRAQARAKKAIQVEVQKHKVDSMEHELNLLHTIDKGGIRTARVKTSAAVKSSEESPAVAQAFESAFLSRPPEDEVYTDDSSDGVSIDEEEEEEKDAETTVMTMTRPDDSRDSKVRFNRQLEQGRSVRISQENMKGVEKSVLKGNVSTSGGSSIGTRLSSQSSGPPAGPIPTSTGGTPPVVPHAAPAYQAGQPIVSSIPKARGPPRKSPPRQDKHAAHRAALPRHTNDVDISIVNTNENDIADSLNFSTASHAAPAWAAPHPTLPGGFGTGTTGTEDDTSVNFEEMADYNADEGLSVSSSDYQLWEDTLAYPQESAAGGALGGDLSAVDVLSQHMNAYGISSSGGGNNVDDVEVMRRSETPIDFSESMFNQTIGKPGKGNVTSLTSRSDLHLNALPLGFNDDEYEAINGPQLGIHLGLDDDGMTNMHLKYDNFYSPGTDSLGNWSHSQRHSVESNTLSTASTIRARHDDEISSSHHPDFIEANQSHNSLESDIYEYVDTDEVEMLALEDAFLTKMISMSTDKNEHVYGDINDDNQEYHNISVLSDPMESNGDDTCFNVSTFENSTVDATVDTYSENDGDDNVENGDIQVIQHDDDDDSDSDSDGSDTVAKEAESETNTSIGSEQLAFHDQITTTTSPPYPAPPTTTISTNVVDANNDDIIKPTLSQYEELGADPFEHSPYRHDSGVDSDDELPLYADEDDGDDVHSPTNFNTQSDDDDNDDDDKSDDDLPGWAGGTVTTTIQTAQNNDDSHSSRNDSNSMDLATQTSILEHVKLLVESEKQAIDDHEASTLTSLSSNSISTGYTSTTLTTHQDHTQDGANHGTEIDADAFINAFLAQDSLTSRAGIDDDLINTDLTSDSQKQNDYAENSISAVIMNNTGGYGTTINGNTSPVISPSKDKGAFSIESFVDKYTQSSSDEEEEEDISHSHATYDSSDNHKIGEEDNAMSPLKQALGVRNSMEYKALLSQRLKTALVYDSSDDGDMNDDDDSLDFHAMLSPIHMPKHNRQYGGRVTSYVPGKDGQIGVVKDHETPDIDASLSSLDASQGTRSKLAIDVPSTTTPPSDLSINTKNSQENEMKNRDHELHTAQLMKDIDDSKNRLLEHMKASLDALHRPYIHSHQNRNNMSSMRESIQSLESDASSLSYYPLDHHNTSIHSDIDISAGVTHLSGQVSEEHRSLATTITESHSNDGSDSTGSLAQYPLAQLSQLSNDLSLSMSQNIHTSPINSIIEESTLDGDDNAFTSQVDELVEQYLSSMHSAYSDLGTSGSEQLLSEGELSALHLRDNGDNSEEEK